MFFLLISVCEVSGFLREIPFNPPYLRVLKKTWSFTEIWKFLVPAAPLTPAGILVSVSEASDHSSSVYV